MKGNFESSRGLIARLPKALNLPPESITQAIEETRRQIRDREEQAYRASFKPHAIILTDRQIPTQIVIAIMVGAHRFLHIDLDLRQPRRSYVHHALGEFHLRMREWGGDCVPFFGRPVGLVVNYAPDRAVRYDLNGSAVEVLRGAHKEGEASLQIGRRRLTAEQVSPVFTKG